MRQAAVARASAQRFDVRPEALLRRSYASAAVPNALLHSVEGRDALPDIAKEDSFDIVIIGAGNAGLALAATLRKSCLCVALEQHLIWLQSPSRPYLLKRVSSSLMRARSTRSDTGRKRGRGRTGLAA